jgi:hypothetical protein
MPMKKGGRTRGRMKAKGEGERDEGRRAKDEE